MATFFERAQALMPWMPRAALRVYAETWAATGDREQAKSAVRQDERYDTEWFAGNRRENGTLRMGEKAYVTYKYDYRRELAQRDINPDLFESQFADLMRGEVSPAEFKARLGAIDDRVMKAAPQVKQWYAAQYGLDVTTSAIYAGLLDPKLGEDIVNQRIGMAEIGGAAALRGFNRTAADAERLFNRGLDKANADALYSQAQGQLSGLDTLAKRFRDQDSTFDLDEFEEGFLGDATQKQRAERLVGAERSSFSSQRRVAEDQTGGLRGLKQR